MNEIFWVKVMRFICSQREEENMKLHYEVDKIMNKKQEEYYFESCGRVQL